MPSSGHRPFGPGGSGSRLFDRAMFRRIKTTKQVKSRIIAGILHPAAEALPGSPLQRELLNLRFEGVDEYKIFNVKGGAFQLHRSREHLALRSGDRNAC